MPTSHLLRLKVQLFSEPDAEDQITRAGAHEEKEESSHYISSTLP